jgi:hypothetical protein
MFHAESDWERFEPRQLSGIHVVAVERKEGGIAFSQAVVALAIHVEGRVEALIGIVVVPQCRIKLHAAIKQGLIRIFELLPVIGWSLRAIDIVAHHEHEVERKLCMVACHQSAYLVLFPFARTAIADNRKPD